MPFTGKVGDTLYLSDAGGRHRYVILTEPNSNGDVVVVNFTSVRHWKECLVTFRPKDDKGLFDTKTTVLFSDARIVSIKRLAKVAKRKPRDYEFCSENHVQRIVIGAFQSQLTPIGVLEELRMQYPNEYERYCEKDY